jgi:hypothetical protein
MERIWFFEYLGDKTQPTTETVDISQNYHNTLNATVQILPDINTLYVVSPRKYPRITTQTIPYNVQKLRVHREKMYDFIEKQNIQRLYVHTTDRGTINIYGTNPFEDGEKYPIEEVHFTQFDTEIVFTVNGFEVEGSLNKEQRQKLVTDYVESTVSL